MAEVADPIPREQSLRLPSSAAIVGEKQSNNEEARIITETNHNNNDNKSDQNERFSLRVKPEFILELNETPPPPPERAEPAMEEQGQEEADEGKHKKKKKKRGMNKKRPRDERISDTDKLCLYVVRGEPCPHENCRFSHDVKEFWVKRPPDITQVEGGCPKYNLFGYCEFGVNCRLGGCHLNLSTGANLRKDVKEEDMPKPLRNVVSRSVQITLRKKKYQFKCKRHHEKQDNNNHNNNNFTTPVPNKERKLIDFANKVYVAPLTTVGNLPFRRIMKRFGADITCGEMAVATCLLEGRNSEWALLKRHPCEDVFGIQLAAGHADQFTRISEVIENEGLAVDFVDLNLGCPLDLICKKGAGAGLMQRDKKLKQSLIGITNTLSCPVTVKMRTGWDEKKPFAHELVAKIQSWGIDGVAAVMIHGRSRLQRYQKLANWDYISRVATSQSDDDKPRIPVIGNGDVFSYTDYEEKMRVEGVQATAMLGRGALIKPWLPTEIKERRHWDISATERLDILKDFVKFGLEHWGSDQTGVNNTRRFLLEWLSFLHRYVPVGLLEVLPQQMNQRPPARMCGRNDLETLFLSKYSHDWVKITEILLGPVPDGFQFEPKHKANSYGSG